MTTFHIITLFPEICQPYVNTSILGRAKTARVFNIHFYQLRDWATDKHKTVDDTPYGGGAGMLLKPEPIHRCVQKIKNDILLQKDFASESSSRPSISISRKNKINLYSKEKKNTTLSSQHIHTVLLSAKGRQYNQKIAAEYAKNYNHIILICGRYEGVDERIALHVADEEICVGPYVLTGGELPALTIVDSVVRLLPGALGNNESTQQESHTDEDSGEYPQYTKPACYEGWCVPDILLSGNHQEIAQWRKKQRI